MLRDAEGKNEDTNKQTAKYKQNKIKGRRKKKKKKIKSDRK